MSTVAVIAVAIVAALHVGFFVLESFLWDRPTGRRVFGHRPEEAQVTRVLALNQGVYNAFLAAGLVWALLAPATLAVDLATFFLGCVVVAGVVGGLSAARAILVVQAAPALVALGLVLGS